MGEKSQHFYVKVFLFFKGYRVPSLKGTAIAVKSCKV